MKKKNIFIIKCPLYTINPTLPMTERLRRTPYSCIVFYIFFFWCFLHFFLVFFFLVFFFSYLYLYNAVDVAGPLYNATISGTITERRAPRAAGGPRRRVSGPYPDSARAARDRVLFRTHDPHDSVRQIRYRPRARITIPNNTISFPINVQKMFVGFCEFIKPTAKKVAILKPPHPARLIF